VTYFTDFIFGMVVIGSLVRFAKNVSGRCASFLLMVGSRAWRVIRLSNDFYLAWPEMLILFSENHNACI
jgi:hypothetical protein